MNLKHNLKELFTFSKKERIAIIIILFIVLIVAFLPFYNSGSRTTDETVLDSSLIAENNTLNEISNDSVVQKIGINAADYQIDKPEDSYNNAPKGTLFSFDPNTLDANGFKKLGLRDRTIKTIFNYRSKGGKFRKPDDFQKIYNLRQDEFERLKPYIAIESTGYSKSYSDNANYKKSYNTDAAFSNNKPKYLRKIIEVNSADAAAYESLYGIGKKLASRIIHFRDKLGGFYSVDQVGETYGVPDSTFQKIKSQLQINRELVRKININTATYDALNIHPYINKRTAYLILKQRKEKGNFQSIEEIRNILSQTNDSFEKVAPYIKTD